MEIELRLKNTLERIKALEIKFGRQPNSVQLLVVSKRHSIADIRQAADLKQKAFGENVIQEALKKITALQEYPLEWHFIGPVQSNKTKAIAEHFAWIHSLDRLKVAQRISKQRPSHLAPINVCIQVNIDNEPTKAGVSLKNLALLANQVVQLPQLNLRGLMTIPKKRHSFAEQCQPFRKLRQALDSLNAEGLTLDTLSMGMSDDYEAAIAEGATIIRLGTAVFGPRT